MSTHQIHVFVSHSWSYSEHYETLAKWIFEERWNVGQASLDFRDYSVPRSSPIHVIPSSNALKNAIYQQIALSHVVVIPTGMYSSHSDWIQKEIDGAQQYDKPILAVNPWGQERHSSKVVRASMARVGWNKEPLVTKIWQLYRRPSA